MTDKKLGFLHRHRHRHRHRHTFTVREVGRISSAGKLLRNKIQGFSREKERERGREDLFFRRPLTGQNPRFCYIFTGRQRDRNIEENYFVDKF